MSRATRRTMYMGVAALAILLALTVAGIGGGGHILLNAGIFRPAVTNYWWWNSRGMTLEQIVVSNHNSHDVSAVAALNGIAADPNMVINGCIALRIEGMAYKNVRQGVAANCANGVKYTEAQQAANAGQTVNTNRANYPTVARFKAITNHPDLVSKNRDLYMGDRLLDLMSDYSEHVRWGWTNREITGGAVKSFVRVTVAPRGEQQFIDLNPGLVVFQCGPDRFGYACWALPKDDVVKLHPLYTKYDQLLLQGEARPDQIWDYWK